ncbi:hypothetical protein ABTN43_20035, partial [Acinetobacter baumannii]
RPCARAATSSRPTSPASDAPLPAERHRCPFRLDRGCGAGAVAGGVGGGVLDRPRRGPPELSAAGPGPAGHRRRPRARPD